jgi:hypothetical protein
MNTSTNPFYLTEETGLPIGRRAVRLHSHLLPTWQKPDEATSQFIALMLQAGAVGHIVYCLGRAFSRELLSLLIQAEAYELIRGLTNAIELGRSLLDEEGALEPDGLDPDTFLPI